MLLSREVELVPLESTKGRDTEMTVSEQFELAYPRSNWIVVEHITIHDKANAWVDGPHFGALAHRSDGFSPGLHASAARTPCSSSFADGFGRRI